MGAASEAQLPPFELTTENDVPEELAGAKRAGCDLVITDTSVARSTEALVVDIQTSVYDPPERAAISSEQAGQRPTARRAG